MGIGALVFCDCVETDRLRVKPPEGIRVTIDDLGEPVCEATDASVQERFAAWVNEGPCAHEDFVLADVRLANISAVIELSHLLEQRKDSFPLIYRRILGGGFPPGEPVTPSEFADLEAEVDQLGTRLPRIVRKMASDLKTLLEAGRSVNKPIVFG